MPAAMAVRPRQMRDDAGDASIGALAADLSVKRTQRPELPGIRSSVSGRSSTEARCSVPTDPVARVS